MEYDPDFVTEYIEQSRQKVINIDYALKTQVMTDYTSRLLKDIREDYNEIVEHFKEYADLIEERLNELIGDKDGSN